MKKLLLIEDDPVMQVLIRETFVPSPVLCYNTLNDFAAKRHELIEFSAILVDLNLPDGNGLSLIHQMITRTKKLNIPVLVISAESDISKKYMAFDLGVEDYITKPFDPMELKIRVQAKIKRSQTSSAQVAIDKALLLLDKGGLEYQDSNGKLEFLELTQKEMKLLGLMAQSPQQIFSRERILEAVWPESYINDRTIDSHIAKLRAKLSPTPVRIQTHKGLGYSLMPLN